MSFQSWLHGNLFVFICLVSLFTLNLVDHSILVNKLRNLKVPRSIVNWITDLWSNPSQRITLANGYYEWGTTGYQIGPTAFCIDNK